MTDTPASSAELVSKVLDSTQQLTRRGHRLTGMVIVFLLAVSGFLIYLHVSDQSTISGQRAAYTTLSNKSAEQTVAEVQLRDDVNNLSKLNKSLSADHGESVQLFCSILTAVHDKSTVYMKYCPVSVP